jgi:uncharacterized protein (TIGR04255 family)
MRTSEMSLGNPPIVEARLGFSFQSGESSPSWELDAATAFLMQHSDEFVEFKLEQRCRENFRVESRNADDLPDRVHLERMVDRIRIGNGDGTRWLQIGANLISFHLVRGSDGYPGWSALRDNSVRFLAGYSERFCPDRVLTTTIHYVDIVEVPIEDGVALKLEDYFNLGIRDPGPPFDRTNGFGLELSFRSARETNDQVCVSFSLDSPRCDEQVDAEQSGSRAMRFRLEWNLECRGIDSLDREIITRRLNAAHTELYSYFKQCFTERCWQLFDPQDEQNHVS